MIWSHISSCQILYVYIKFLVATRTYLNGIIKATKVGHTAKIRTLPLTDKSN